MRTLLFTGPGGAGTTTLAASAAVRAARAGRRTLLLGRQPVPSPELATVPGLDIVTVDAQAAFERVWDTSLGVVGGVLPQLALPPTSSVVPLPGMAELATFGQLGRAEADLVVVDAGPLDSAAALLALPTTLRWWLEQLLPPGVRALGAVRTAAAALGGVRRGPVDAALAVVPLVEDLLSRDRLADPVDTAVCFVAGARRGAPAALRGAATTLGLHGLRAGAVFARVLPPGGAGDWWAERAAEQDAALAELAEVAPVVCVPETATEPRAVETLADLLDGVALPADGGPVPPSPIRRDGSWMLMVPLPFADKDSVDLTRWRDELVITVGGARRSMRLDSLLRRCEVTGGRLLEPRTAAACLEVSFRPDPRLWPADLLAAERRSS